MWSTRVTLNPMVLEDTMVKLKFLLKSDFMFIKYLDPIMVPTDTMGFRVTMVDTMCLCNHGLSLYDLKQTSSGKSKFKKAMTIAADAHGVLCGNPEPHRVGWVVWQDLLLNVLTHIYEFQV